LRPEPGSIDRIEFSHRFATNGPEHRYNTVLFVEKEGFEPLIKAASLAERFDIAIMSTKGMSTTAARLLLDQLSARGVQQILVLHDFDVSGLSIFGTLGTDTRRYQFADDIRSLTSVCGSMMSKRWTCSPNQSPLRATGASVQ
jgi:DNA topoisomerase VI subunit A